MSYARWLLSRLILLPIQGWLAISITLLFIIWHGFIVPIQKPGYGKTDLAVFYVAGQTITGQTQIKPVELYIQKSIRPQLEPYNQKTATHFLYTPPAAVLFAPLGFGSFAFWLKAWPLISAVSFVLAYWLAIQYLVSPGNATRWYDWKFSLLLGLALVSLPVESLFSTGQVNSIVGLLLVLGWIGVAKQSSASQYISGISLAVATVMKLFPGIFLLWLLIKRQYKAAVVFCTTGIVLVLMTLPWFSIADWRFFLTGRFVEVLNSQTGTLSKSASLYGSFRNAAENGLLEWAGRTGKELTQLINAPYLVLTVAALLFTLWLVYRVKDRASAQIHLISASALLAVVLLFAKDVKLQYVLWLLPVAALFVSDYSTTVSMSNWKRVVFSICAIVGVLAVLFGGLLNDIAGTEFLIKPTTLGILIIYSLCVIQLIRKP